MMECHICCSKEDLIRIRDEKGEIISVCEECYESEYSGYEKIDADPSEEGWEEDWVDEETADEEKDEET